MDLMKNETHLMSFADDEDWDADMEEEFAEYGSLDLVREIENMMIN